LFVPFTGAFAQRLETLIPQRDAQEARYLNEVSSGVGQVAIEAVERETSLLIARTVRLIMLAYEPRLQTPPGQSPMPHQLGIETQELRPFNDLYRATKTLEGELVEFTIRLTTGELDADDSQRLSQLLSAAREAMHSAKAVKNIRHNLLDLAQPGSALPADYAEQFRSSGIALLQNLYNLRGEGDDKVEFEELADMLQQIHQQHDALHNEIYAGVRTNRISQTEVSSLLNVNRELLTSGRALVFALGDYFLTTDRADDLERVPV
jgi:phosphate:Na+ symporter